MIDCQMCQFNTCILFVCVALDYSRFQPPLKLNCLRSGPYPKGKIIREAESLTASPVLQSLLKSARSDESPEEGPGISSQSNKPWTVTWSWLDCFEM